MQKMNIELHKVKGLSGEMPKKRQELSFLIWAGTVKIFQLEFSSNSLFILELCQNPRETS